MGRVDRCQCLSFPWLWALTGLGKLKRKARLPKSNFNARWKLTWTWSCTCFPSDLRPLPFMTLVTIFIFFVKKWMETRIVSKMFCAHPRIRVVFGSRDNRLYLYYIINLTKSHRQRGQNKMKIDQKITFWHDQFQLANGVWTGIGDSILSLTTSIKALDFLELTSEVR